MFNTFKIDPETNSVQELRRASDPISARSSQHQACNNCHAKKLKCSGDKSGCERCIASQLRCEYTRSPSRRGGRKTSGRSSTDSRGGLEPAGGDSSPGSQSGKSRHRSSRHLHAGTSSSSRARASASREEEYGDALDLFDPTTLGPDDGFDLRSLSLEASDSGYGNSAYYNQQQQQQQQQQHGAGSWQHVASSDPYGNLSGSSYMGTTSSSGQDYDVDYYGNYDEYGQYHGQQNDPRYWGGQQQ